MFKKYGTKINKIVDQFSSLVKYTEKLAFPDHRKGVLSQQDMTGWGRIRKAIYRIAHAGFSIDDPNLINTILYLIWSYISIGSMTIGIVFIQPNLYDLVFPGIQPHSLANDTTILIIAFIPVILLVPVAVYWWYEIISEKRYPIILKTILVLVFAGLLFGFSSKLGLNAPISSWIDPGSGLLLSHILYIIPAITYFMAISLDLLIQGMYLFKILFSGIKSIHNPLPFNEIKELLLADIPDQPNAKPWRMSKLTMLEIQTMHKWALANRDATEKRTIPTSVALGAVGVFTISTALRAWIDNFIAGWFSNLTTIYSSPFSLPILTMLFDIGLLILVFAMFTSIAVSLVRLFINLAVQNIIIETCILAQFGKKK